MKTTTTTTIKMNVDRSSSFSMIRNNNKSIEMLSFLAFILIMQQVATGPIQFSLALRTGAPSMACMNMRPMHGLNRPKPASSSQFFIRQSSLSYGPGQLIDVEIMTYSQSRHFRGFLIQAYDPLSGHHLGHFAPSKESRPLDICSAATHRDNSDKQHVKLVWLSPGASLPAGMDLGAPAHNTPQWRSPIQPSINFSILHKRQLVNVSTNVTHIHPTQLPTSGSSADKPVQSATEPSSSSSADSAAGGMPAPSAANASQQRATAPAPQQTGAQASSNQMQMKSVRFKATIVVSYDEFYMGFESSDSSYDAFSYANGTTTTTN